MNRLYLPIEFHFYPWQSDSKIPLYHSNGERDIEVYNFFSNFSDDINRRIKSFHFDGYISEQKPFKYVGIFTKDNAVLVVDFIVSDVPDSIFEVDTCRNRAYAYCDEIMVDWWLNHIYFNDKCYQGEDAAWSELRYDIESAVCEWNDKIQPGD